MAEEDQSKWISAWFDMRGRQEHELMHLNARSVADFLVT
jgi:hypothetical protein